VVHAPALTVNQVPAFTSAPAVAGKAGAPLAPVTVKASGYPTAVITATGLPSGLKLTGMGGGTAVISGTPAASESGPYTVSLRAHNRVGVVTQQLIVTILP